MKRALVTGGAHPIGIGFAAAKALIEDGYEVTVTGLNDSEIALMEKTDRIRAVVLDVRDDAAVFSVIAQFDRLDAVVNCAGVSSSNEFDSKAFGRTLDINLTGTMRVCTAAKPLLAEAKGAIVNIASMMAYRGSPAVPAYSASKGGVVQLTKSLAAAWGADGIRVNAIAPGWIKTDMARALWENPEMEGQITARTPLGRWGVAQDCGDAIAFLCSRRARFITGVTVPVDGGYLVTA